MVLIQLIVILLYFGLISGYPGGAPSCMSRPGHGVNRGVTKMKIVKIGERKWKVLIISTYFFLSLNVF